MNAAAALWQLDATMQTTNLFRLFSFILRGVASISVLSISNTDFVNFEQKLLIYIILYGNRKYRC